MRAMIASIFMLFMLFSTAQAEDKKITIKDVQTKVSSLQTSVSKTIEALKKSNKNSADLKGQIKVLGETIKILEAQLATIKAGGEIYTSTGDAQEISKKNVKLFEEKIQSGTLSQETIKGFEALIKRQNGIINELANLQVEMNEKASRIEAKIKQLKSNQELVVATMLVDEQEAAKNQLKKCLEIFDDIEDDIDDLNKRANPTTSAPDN